MRVFLSGKVDERYGAWRDHLLGVSHQGRTNNGKWVVEAYPRWVVYEDEPTGAVLPWPKLPKVILNDHTYVGPYRQVVKKESDWRHDGYFHGVTAIGSHGMIYGDVFDQVVARCRGALQDADFVFAYINSPDAYGTIAEIGYAAALGKFVAVVIDPEAAFDWTDFRFVESLANFTRTIEREVAPPHEGRYVDEPLTPERERAQLVDALKDAALVYLGQPRSTAVVAAVDMQEERWQRFAREVTASFDQIARWTSDPRVRNEAQRMMRRMGA